MKVKIYYGLLFGAVILALIGAMLVSLSDAQQILWQNGDPVCQAPHSVHATPVSKFTRAIWDRDHDTGIQAEASSDEDCLRFKTANREIMVIDEAGNVGIGEASPNDCKLYVKSQMLDWQYAIYGEGRQGVRGVSNAFEGTGVYGEGGHAGVAGNGFIGILGSGFYGGWFLGHGTFSGNLGVGISEPENRLHVNGAINLDPVDEPAQPSAGFVLYCDSVDGKLKAKSSAGTITVLADH